MESVPRSLATGSKFAPSVRSTLKLTLALATLATPLAGAPSPGDPVRTDGAAAPSSETSPASNGADSGTVHVTKAEPRSTASRGAVAGGAAGRVDPRGPQVELLCAEPDPDGHWLALRAARQRPYELALWFVDLESGMFHLFEDGEPTTAPMMWLDGKLMAEVRRSGRREIVAIDPSSHAFEGLDRLTELDPQWSGTVITRRSGGRRVLTVEWIESGERFELPDGPDTDYRLVEEPGFVFYSQPDEGGATGLSSPALRIWRHDMRTGENREVATVGGKQPLWVPSPDASLVAICDDYRTRMVDPEDGATVFGPWPAGEVIWIGEGHGHVLLTSGGHHHLLDVYSGKRTLIGPDEGETPEVSVLPGGDFLVRRGQQLEHRSATGELIAQLLGDGEVR